MLFGILSKANIDFKCKAYEDCLYDIAVTHSPRYLIDMNLNDKENTVFYKMGITYDKFRRLGNEQIEYVRKYYKNRIKESGGKTMPWWIGEVEEVSSYMPSVLYTENTTLKLLNDFEQADKAKLKQYIQFFSFLAFPQILGTSPDKFRATTLWLCSRHSIIISNIRDLFSAGGTGIIKDIEDKTLWKNVPKIICNMLVFTDKFSEVFTNESQLLNELAVYADYYETGKDNFDIWKKKNDENLKILQNNCDTPILVKDLLTMKLHSAKDSIYKVEIK